MADRTVQVVLRAIVGPYQAAMARATTSTAGLNTQVGRLTPGVGRLTGGLNRTAPGLDKASRGAGRMAGSVGGLNAKLLGAGGLVAGIAATTGAAIEWESAFADVRKTVDGTPEQLGQISDSLRRLSTEIPTSAEELAAIASSAGQLGIETDNVIDFTKVIADLGETTNLAGQQGATELARFANITAMSQDDFDRLGSTIVDLGNNFATTEAEISTMAMRIAGAGRQVGMSESDILAYATALSSVGIEAQAGGTAISRVFLEIQSAVMDGGDALDGFADVADMSVSEFARLFRDDAARATREFIAGLGRISEEGGNTSAVLDDLELGEIRVRDALLRASGAGDLLTEAIERGNAAWEENNALTEEAALRYETTEAKLDMAKNQVRDLAREIGALAAPVVGGGADIMNTSISNARAQGDQPGGLFGNSILGRMFADEPKPKSAWLGTLTDGIANADKVIADLVSGAGEDLLGWLAAAAGVSGDFATAQERAAAATREARSELAEHVDELAGMADPIFSAVDAYFDKEEALANVAEVQSHLNDENEETRTSLEDLDQAERDAAESAVRFAQKLGGLVDEEGNLIASTDTVMRRLSALGLPPEVVNQILTDIMMITGELDALAGFDPEIMVHITVDRSELDALNAQFGNVATGHGASPGGRTGGTGTVDQNISDSRVSIPARLSNIPRSHTGEGRVSGGLGWMPGLDDDERLRVVRLGESIQPAFRPADGMGGGSSTSIGRQVTVGAGAIQLVVRDADDGMRAGAEKLDLMAGGFI